APAVARAHFHPPFERLHRGEPRRDAPGVEDLRAAVARDPERRLPVLAPAATAGEGEREQQEGCTSHSSAFERTAPSAVARRGSPLWAAGQAFWPALAAIVLLEPMCSTRFETGVCFPLSSSACAT